MSVEWNMGLFKYIRISVKTRRKPIFEGKGEIPITYSTLPSSKKVLKIINDQRFLLRCRTFDSPVRSQYSTVSKASSGE